MPQAVSEVLGYATFAYVVGFLTLLANTAKYGLPILEFIRPLNLWIGVFPTAVIVGSFVIFRKWRRLNPEGVKIALSDVLYDILGMLLFLGGSFFLGWFVLESMILVLLGHRDPLHPNPLPLPMPAPAIALAHWMERHRQLLAWILRVSIFLTLVFTPPASEKSTAQPWTKQFWNDVWAHNVRFWRDVWSTGSHRHLRYLVVGSTLGVLSIYTWFVFPSLPQRYGFGRPTTVQLLVDTELLPLLPADNPLGNAIDGSPPGASAGKIVYLSEPVELLFIAEKEYVLRCASGNHRRIITIQSTTVRGIVWRSEP